MQNTHRHTNNSGRKKLDGLLRDRDKVFFVEEGSEGSQEAIRSNHTAVKTSNCHELRHRTANDVSSYYALPRNSFIS